MKNTRQHPPTVTRARWQQLAAELTVLSAVSADDFDRARERVGQLVTREALALNVSTEIKAVSP